MTNLKPENTMIDLSSLSLAEIERLAADEKARRKAKALHELEAVAERHGYSLRELTGSKAATRRNPYGAAKKTIIEMLRDGKSAEEIRQAVGWQNAGAVYAYARSAGIAIKNGRAVQ